MARKAGNHPQQAALLAGLSNRVHEAKQCGRIAAAQWRSTNCNRHKFRGAPACRQLPPKPNRLPTYLPHFLNCHRPLFDVAAAPRARQLQNRVACDAWQDGARQARRGQHAAAAALRQGRR